MARKGNPISAIIRSFFPFLTLIASHFVLSFIGSEGTAIMTAGVNLVLFGILLMILTFLFRIYYSNLNTKYGFPLVFLISLMILFSISLFGCWLRTHFLSPFFVHFVVFYVGSGGGQPLPLPSPSSPSDEDSFGIQVLSEPWPVTPNCGFESSLRNRIQVLENENCNFLLDKEKGEYWEEVRRQLENCTSQREYNRLLEFENRDLQMRELKHSCFSQFQRVVAGHPALAETANNNPLEYFEDFLDEHRSELEREVGIPDPSLVVDQKQLQFLHELDRDLGKYGQDSVYIDLILGREY